MDLVYRNEKKLFKIAFVIATIFWVLLVLGTLGIALIYLLFGFIFYLFVQSAFITHLKGNGVKITPSQYPDLHESLIKCCKKVGVPIPPDMYLLRTDFFNALATKFLGREFIVLFTDVVDALEDKPSAIDFYVGHELGHIHRKHLKWMVYLAPALFLPVLGPAYRRAEEYTCDRYGAACCDDEESVKVALATISAGDSRWKDLNAQEYLNQIPESSGFWMSFHELTGEYPWLTKRMASALAFRRNEDIRHPRRSFFAGFLSIFVPRGGFLSLVITFAMLGFFLAIAIPQYADYKARTEIAGAMTRAFPLRSAIHQYAIDNNGTFPSTLSEVGFEKDAFSTETGDYSIDLYENGIIGITLGVDASGTTRYLVYEPYIEEGNLLWACYGQNAEERLIPSSCQQ